MLHILNGVIHEVEPRWRRNEEGRREYKHFNASVVMLVFYVFEINAAGNYHSQKIYRRLSVSLCYILGSHCESSHIDPVQFDIIEFD